MWVTETFNGKMELQDEVIGDVYDDRGYHWIEGENNILQVGTFMEGELIIMKLQNGEYSDMEEAEEENDEAKIVDDRPPYGEEV